MTSALHGSVPDWLRDRARLSPDRVALETDATRFTYRELNAEVNAMAARLVATGVKPGEIVALLAQNGAVFARAVHAVPRAGAVLMPLNLRLTPAELTWQITDANAHRILHDAAHHDLAGALREEVVPLELIDIEAPTARGPNTPSPIPRFDLAALHSVVYTSGTTGRPKGAMLTYGNHLWSATASALNLGLRPDDRWLACLPLFHVGGLSILLRSVIYGTTAVVHAGFDPTRVNAAIDTEGVTIVSVVANMLQRMLDEHGDRPYPPSLRCVLLGGGPAPEPLLQRCAALGVPIVQTYGLTETASQIATLAPQDALRKLGSAGKPLFGAELRILGETGAECPPDEAGEIVVRGPSVTPGYLNRSDETNAAIRDGWLHTGDLGYLDAEGDLYVLDRRDDLIVSGGENVYPAEVEAILQSHPDVAEAGVYGIDDERWGRAPVAIVVLREGASPDAKALLAHCGKRLAAYKTPKRIEFTDTLPRNAAGKLMRNQLGGVSSHS